MKNMVRVIVTVIVLTGIFFGIIRLMKTGDPWELRFSTNNQGCADVLITNKKLNIDGARVRTQTPVPPHFKEIAVTARQGMAVPVGKMIFSDFTTLPGRLTLVIGTHSMDIMQRALVIDGKEITWQQAMENPVELEGP